MQVKKNLFYMKTSYGNSQKLHREGLSTNAWMHWWMLVNVLVNIIVAAIRVNSLMVKLRCDPSWAFATFHETSALVKTLFFLSA